ncbi:MAG TPA: hypothetical protein VFO80_04205 [Sphingomonas sp.]|nr:hypothetical protein [Sphingomonas sp.]
MSLFVLWAGAVCWTVWKRLPWLWSVTCLVPLGFVSISYYADITRGGDDLFGVRSAMPFLFLGMALVIASSGIMSMILVHHPTREVEAGRSSKTVFQKLFWGVPSDR